MVCVTTNRAHVRHSHGQTATETQISQITAKLAIWNVLKRNSNTNNMAMLGCESSDTAGRVLIFSWKIVWRRVDFARPKSTSCGGRRFELNVIWRWLRLLPNCLLRFHSHAILGYSSKSENYGDCMKGIIRAWYSPFSYGILKRGGRVSCFLEQMNSSETVSSPYWHLVQFKSISSKEQA